MVSPSSNFEKISYSRPCPTRTTGPAEYFAGAVRIDPLFEAPEPARVRGASVTFEPGARTASHTHPLGQTLCSAGAAPLRKSGRAT